MCDTNLHSAVEQLKKGIEVNVLTSGVSMRPMLRQHKDIVVIVPVNRKLKKGDVVLYPNRKGDSVLHRIMRFSKDGSYIIRGDNNYFTEYGITDADIVGILKEFYRDGIYVDCATNKKYKLYTFWICHSYYLRYLWKKILCPFLVKIKHAVFGKKK